MVGSTAKAGIPRVVTARDLGIMKLCPKSYFQVKMLPQIALQYSLGKQGNLGPVIINITSVQHWDTQQL